MLKTNQKLKTKKRIPKILLEDVKHNSSLVAKESINENEIEDNKNIKLFEKYIVITGILLASVIIQFIVTYAYTIDIYSWYKQIGFFYACTYVGISLILLGTSVLLLNIRFDSAIMSKKDEDLTDIEFSRFIRLESRKYVLISCLLFTFLGVRIVPLLYVTPMISDFANYLNRVLPLISTEIFKGLSSIISWIVSGVIGNLFYDVLKSWYLKRKIKKSDK